MADEPAEPVASEAMDLAKPVPAARPPEAEIDTDQVSLGRRLRQPRTILSIVLPLFLLVLFARSLPGFNLSALPGEILAANPWLLLVAFLVFYAGFPLRGYRWAILIRATGYPLKVKDSTEIIFLSWLVNCLVPAKLGDVYRAYLLKLNAGVSLSRSFGTIFIERILDLFTIVVLGLAAGYISFRGRLPTDVQIVFGIGLAVMIVLAILLLSLRSFGRQIFLFLPVPERFLELYDRFEEGVFSAVNRRQLPILLILTGLIWSTEAFRLYFVVEALGFPGVHLGISGAFFVALTGSLLTAVPLTPAGLGIVEAGIVGVLTLVYNVPQTEALTIVVVDRAISVLSVIILGSILYVVSPMRRGTGITPAAHVSEPAVRF
jgi:glycosyltransferase 2 family protein